MTLNRKLFGDKEFYKYALLLALPVMGQNLVENLVNLIDNFMVSGLGDIKMSGTSVAGQVIVVFMVLLNAICMSGGIFVTQFFGAGDRKRMKQAIGFKAAIALMMYVIYLMVCLVFPRQVLGLMVVGNTQADLIIAQGVRYMRVMSLMGLPMIICYISSSSLKETGRVKEPLYVSLLAAFVNMVFNYLLIYGNFGFPRLEVVGAAIATVIARSVEACLFIYLLKKSDSPLLIGISDILGIDRKLFVQMFKRSMAIVMSEMIWALTETVTTALYNGKGGADVVSGMSASFTIANLYFTAFGGVNVATSVIIGKLLGQGKLDDAREKKNWLFSGVLVFSVVVTLIAMSTSLLVPFIYSNLSISAQAICERMVFYMALFMPAWIIMNVQFAIARAGGDTTMNFVIDGLGNVFVMLPLVIYLALFTPTGPVGIYIISKFVDVAKIVIFYFWLKKETWLVNLTVQQ